MIYLEGGESVLAEEGAIVVSRDYSGWIRIRWELSNEGPQYFLAVPNLEALERMHAFVTAALPKLRAAVTA